MKTQNEERGQTPLAPKKLYERPRVVTFGTLAKLTQAKLSTSSDGASHKGTKVKH